MSFKENVTLINKVLSRYVCRQQLESIVRRVWQKSQECLNFRQGIFDMVQPSTKPETSCTPSVHYHWTTEVVSMVTTIWKLIWKEWVRCHWHFPELYKLGDDTLLDISCSDIMANYAVNRLGKGTQIFQLWNKFRSKSSIQIFLNHQRCLYLSCQWQLVHTNSCNEA